MRSPPPARSIVIVLVLSVWPQGRAAVEDGPAPPGKPAATRAPVVIRMIHPEKQAAALIHLFDGSQSPHPAAALAAWKQATQAPGQLGKPVEALISFFNPEMIPEWNSLHDSRFSLGLDPASGSLRWRLDVPRDNGTLAALITAMRLSGGAEEPAGGGGAAVERLGGPGAPVASRSPGGLAFASSPAELDRAAIGWPADIGAGAGIASGLAFRIDPENVPITASTSVSTRRAIELARGLGCSRLEGTMAMRDGRLGLEATSSLDPTHPLSRARAGRQSFDPDWLTWIPEAEAAAALCLATGQGAGYWDALFNLVDRVDRAAPDRAGMAPLRARINLLAAAAGARLETDLWPHLRGLTLALLVDSTRAGEPGPVVLALHLDTDESARKLAVEVLPRLAAMGRNNGWPIEAAARGRTVVVGWGKGVIQKSLDSVEHPERSLRSLAEKEADGGGPERTRPDRFGLFWPGRIKLPFRGLDGPSPLAQTLAEGQPILWTGWSLEDHALDRVGWDELGPAVRRFLARIPLAPVAAP